jgi:iron complex outermembrane recepter protein
MVVEGKLLCRSGQSPEKGFITREEKMILKAASSVPRRGAGKTIAALCSLGLSSALVAAPYPGLVHADEVTVDQLTVRSERILKPTRQAGETVYTGTEITARGLEIQGTPAVSSVWEAIGVLPGIQVESVDPYGLSAEQRNIRVRGVRGSLGALTLEGVPNYGGNPIGPRDYLYDMENIQSISVFKGAVPGDIGTGVGSRGGAIVLRPLWPEEEFGARFSQALGSDSYLRTFLRLDSGSLGPHDTRFSGSYSFSQADKWKGPGEIGPRNNVNLMFSQPAGEAVDIKVWLNYNDIEQHHYRPLNYSQVGNLGANYTLDYNERRTGKPGEDIYFYDYNRGSYTNLDLIGLLTITPTDQLHFDLKPYYAGEDTEIFQGVTSAGGRVQQRDRDIDRTGIIAEGTLESRWLTSVGGFLLENSDMQISSTNLGITSGDLAYRGRGVFATTGDTMTFSPYVKFAGSVDKFDWQAGLKYFRFEDSESEGYVTSPPNYAPERAADLDREGETYDIWLPTIGLGYRFSDSLSTYSSYGKNFIRPYMYMPLVNLYNTNRQTFLAAGVPLNDLFAGLDIEESDNVDLGMRVTTPWFEIAPTVYYAKHRNLMVTVYDPRVNLNYNQNAAEATGYGLDLESNFFLGDHFTLFVNPTYTVLEYNDDLVFQGRTLQTEGKQVVDTPEWLVRAGLIFDWHNLEVIPSLRYTSGRYGDATHQEKIDSFTVVDLAVNYTFEEVWFSKSIKLSLELINIFDKEYISSITASDDSRGGSASYYPGAPFSAIVKASFAF